MAEEKKLVKGYIATSDADKASFEQSPEFQRIMKNTLGNLHLSEKLKALALDKETTFPKGLGVQHPFNFDDADKLYKRDGLVAGIVNKIVDAIIGDFYVEVDDNNAKELINSFVHNTNFINNIREWVLEGVLKGNGFLRIDLEDKQLRTISANNMYVQRDKFGKVENYKQYLGNWTTGKLKEKKIIPFEEKEIAHLKINSLPGDAYGCGIVWPNERRVDNMMQNEDDWHQLVKRKAGAPIHAKVGVPGESVQPEDVDRFKTDLQYMNNRTEWVTDANVDMKVLDFGKIGENFVSSLQHDYRMVLAGMEMPEVMMGSGQLNEGIAKVQQETFQRKIKSIRKQIEELIEEKIFKPLLNKNGLDLRPEFVWNLPGETEINERILRVKELLSMNISENMRRQLELELARLFNFEELQDLLPKPEKGADEEKRQEEEEIEQPEVPGAKPNANEGKKPNIEEKKPAQIKKNSQSKETDLTAQIEKDKLRKQSGEMTIQEFVNLQELRGFNYSDYLMTILKNLKNDKFKDLLAKTQEQIKQGLLPKKDIDKLREILRKGFQENQTIREIENELKQNIDFKDRIVDDKVVVKSEKRPNMIARTETVRLANQSLKEVYKENDIKEVRFLAALSDRTCPICEGLNGKIYKMDELNIGESQPPIHPSCRCSLVGIVT